MLGGLWLGLWRRRWRLLGLVPCAAALMVAVLGPRPVLVVDPELDAAARRLPDGRVVMLEWHRASRLRTDWLRALGAAEAVRGPTSGGEAHGIACDEQGCVVTVDGTKVSLSRRAGAAVEDCALAALVVSRAGPEACPAGGRLVGPRALWASQGLTVWRTGGGLEVETVAASRGRWPWSTPPGHAVARKFQPRVETFAPMADRMTAVHASGDGKELSFPGAGRRPLRPALAASWQPAPGRGRGRGAVMAIPPSYTAQAVLLLDPQQPPAWPPPASRPRPPRWTAASSTARPRSWPRARSPSRRSTSSASSATPS